MKPQRRNGGDRVNYPGDGLPRTYPEAVELANDWCYFTSLMLAGEEPHEDEPPWIKKWRTMRRKADDVLSESDWQS